MLPKLVRDHPSHRVSPHPAQTSTILHRGTLNCRSLIGKEFGDRDDRYESKHQHCRGTYPIYAPMLPKSFLIPSQVLILSRNRPALSFNRPILGLLRTSSTRMAGILIDSVIHAVYS